MLLCFRFQTSCHITANCTCVHCWVSAMCVYMRTCHVHKLACLVTCTSSQSIYRGILNLVFSWISATQYWQSRWIHKQCVYRGQYGCILNEIVPKGIHSQLAHHMHTVVAITVNASTPSMMPVTWWFVYMASVLLGKCALLQVWFGIVTVAYVVCGASTKFFTFSGAVVWGGWVELVVYIF